MAKPVLWERHPNPISWAASGTISEELSPKPFTITRMAIVQRLIATTTTGTWYNDPYERVISRLNLTGAGKTYFDVSQVRALYHMSRLAGFGPRRPDKIADSITTGDMYMLHMFHFGVAPTIVDPVTRTLRDNPFDLSAGIPPSSAGNLTLGGSFAAAAAMGSNITITDGDLDIYFCGVRPEPGDAPELYMPRAFPRWDMQSPSLSATSSAFATEHNIPSGDFLHSMLCLLTNGSNDPRDDSVLNSIELYNQLDGSVVSRYGGQTGVVGDYKAAELLSQFNPARITPLSDNVTTAMDAIASGGTPGTIAAGGPPSDSGLVWFDLSGVAHRARTPYGVDMRGVNTGDLKLRYGISDATGVAMHILYRRYQLNPAHPANAGI
ncbi:MAG: hypothetical protein EPO21_13185 [Chloroflexota bacterium]|nr:MAG: hypothetical protein EPO21_13185 [Chloroflexota bacterium]